MFGVNVVYVVHSQEKYEGSHPQHNDKLGVGDHLLHTWGRSGREEVVGSGVQEHGGDVVQCSPQLLLRKQVQILLAGAQRQGVEEPDLFVPTPPVETHTLSSGIHTMVLVNKEPIWLHVRDPVWYLHGRGWKHLEHGPCSGTILTV